MQYVWLCTMYKEVGRLCCTRLLGTSNNKAQLPYQNMKQEQQDLTYTWVLLGMPQRPPYFVFLPYYCNNARSVHRKRNKIQWWQITVYKTKSHMWGTGKTGNTLQYLKQKLMRFTSIIWGWRGAPKKHQQRWRSYLHFSCTTGTRVKRNYLQCC